MMADKTHPAGSAYTALLRTADAAQQGLASFLKPHKITPSQYLALEILCQEEEPLSQGKLSKRMGCTPGNLTLVVVNLAKHKLVQREVSTKDRRFTFLTPSPQGLDLYRKLQSECEAFFQDYFKNLSESELADLAALPDRLQLDN